MPHIDIPSLRPASAYRYRSRIFRTRKDSGQNMVSYSQIKEGCNIYKLTNDASINKAGNLNNGDMVQRRIPLWEN